MNSKTWTNINIGFAVGSDGSTVKMALGYLKGLTATHMCGCHDPAAPRTGPTLRRL